MQDRELLEAAAKAAGIDVRWHENWQCFVRTKPFNTDNPPTMAGERLVWVPLDDDGDALRLAVKLKLDMLPGETSVLVSRSLNHPRRIQEEEDYGDDPAAALRRAIVRAAAAMAG